MCVCVSLCAHVMTVQEDQENRQGAEKRKERESEREREWSKGESERVSDGKYAVAIQPKPCSNIMAYICMH